MITPAQLVIKINLIKLNKYHTAHDKIKLAVLYKSTTTHLATFLNMLN